MLTDSVKALALELGFDLVTAGPATPPEHGPALRRWLEAGHAGTMGYLERRVEERLDPARVLPGRALRSVRGPQLLPGRGARSLLAAGRPLRLGPRLSRRHRAAARAARRAPRRSRRRAEPRLRGHGARARAGPGGRAGLGWIGKNTMLLHPRLGSWFFIGMLLTTAELAHDDPLADRCGTCRACLDACPTGAFVAPYVLDARRCVSYLTIEHRGDIDPEAHAGMAGWQFGCDICQDVCPWNRKAPMTREAAFEPPGPYPGARPCPGWTMSRSGAASQAPRCFERSLRVSAAMPTFTWRMRHESTTG